MLLVRGSHLPIELLQCIPQPVRHRIELIAKFFFQEGKVVIGEALHASRRRKTDDHGLLCQFEELVFGGPRLREIRELRPLPVIIAVLKLRQRIARAEIAIEAELFLQEGLP